MREAFLAATWLVSIGDHDGCHDVEQRSGRCAGTECRAGADRI